jgi:hypothetical protein
MTAAIAYYGKDEAKWKLQSGDIVVGKKPYINPGEWLEVNSEGRYVICVLDAKVKQ